MTQNAVVDTVKCEWASGSTSCYYCKENFAYDEVNSKCSTACIEGCARCKNGKCVMCDVNRNWYSDKYNHCYKSAKVVKAAFSLLFIAAMFLW